MIYGITGKKGHGKDTLAKMTTKRGEGWTILHFADDLKSMCRDVFGLSDAQVNDPVEKERALEHAVYMDKYIPEMRFVTGLDIQHHSKVARTPRELMQYFGTEYVRSIQDDYWIVRTMRKALECSGDVLIPDTRFINEAKAVLNAGGRIIRVVRVGATDSQVGAGHTSETEMDRIKETWRLEIPEGMLSAAEAFAEMLAKGLYR